MNRQERPPSEEELQQYRDEVAELTRRTRGDAADAGVPVESWSAPTSTAAELGYSEAARRFAFRVGELEAELALRDDSAPETDWTYLRVDLIKAVLKAGVLDARQAVRDTAMIEAYCRTGELPAETEAETEADE